MRLLFPFRYPIKLDTLIFGSMGTSAQSSFGWIWIAVSVLILGAGLIVAKVYRY